MTIIELKEQIIKNELSNFYVFVGEEIGIINIYLKQMSNKLNLPITRADSVLSIYSRCMGGSLFGDDVGFYVIRNDFDFMKQEKSYSTIKEDIGKNVIVLLYDKVDSRLKFGKFFKDDTVAFEKLTPNILKSYIKREIPLSDTNIESLMQLCNGSYDLCMLEIDKIKQYHASAYIDRMQVPPIDKAYLDLISMGVIYQPEESDVFKFTEAVCSHNAQEAFEIEKVLRDNGSSSINLLGTLYNSLKSVLLIQCCGSGDKITEVTGLDNRQIYYNKRYVGKYYTEDLVKAVRLIYNVVSGIKSGRIDDAYATRYVLVNIM